MNRSWHDLLPVPLAAPETPRLRAMRLTLVAGALLLALGVANVRAVEKVAGRAGIVLLAALCLAMALLVAAYAVAKLRADAAGAADPEDGQ